MAAGIGSRYGGLKQIDPIGPNGEIIIDYSIYDALQAGFERIVFIVREEIRDEFAGRIAGKMENECDITYVTQRLDDLPEGFRVPPKRSKPWGTAHAVFACRGVIDAPFAVINADDFYGPTSYQMLYDYLLSAHDSQPGYDYCMVSYRLGNTLSSYGHVARGVCSVSENGYLTEIHERKHIQPFDSKVAYTDDGEHWVTISPDTPVSMNMWGFTPSLIAELEPRFARFLQGMPDPIKSEYLLPELISELIAEGRARVSVLPTSEEWFGVTYREDRKIVQDKIIKLIEKGVYPKELWK
jgi:NDP-sugar pyrophosphorylase family protein